jgi:hypothetical protein
VNYFLRSLRIDGVKITHYLETRGVRKRHCKGANSTIAFLIDADMVIQAPRTGDPEATTISTKHHDWTKKSRPTALISYFYFALLDIG